MNTETHKIRLQVDGKEIPNSVNDLAKAQKDLKKELRGLEEGTDQYIKKSQQLTKVTKRHEEVRQKINSTGKAWKKQSAEFKNGITSRVKGVRMYGISIGDLSSGITGVGSAVGGTNKYLKAFKLALASTGIGLIVVAFGSLISYLTSTQSGMDKVTSVTRPLSVLFQRFLGVVQDLGKSLFDMVSSPRKTFESFTSWIQNTFMPTFNGLGEMIGGVGDILANVFDADARNKGMERLQKGISDTGDAIGGLYQKAADGASAAAESVSTFVSESLDQGTAIDQMTKKLEQAEINLIKNKSRLNRVFQEQKTIAADTMATDQERIAAADAAEAAFSTLTKLQNEVLDSKIEKMKLEQTFNDTSRSDLKELAILEAEREDNFAAFEKKRMSIISLRNSALRGELKDIEDGADTEAEANAEKLARMEAAAEAEKVILMQQYADQKLTAIQFNEEMQVLELAALITKKEAMQALGMDIVKIEEAIANAQIQILEKRVEKEEETSQRIREAKEASALSFANEAAMALESARTIEEAARGVLNAVRDAIKKQIAAYISQAVAAQIAKVITSVPFPFNVIAAPLAGAAASALFERVIPSFSSGGFTGSGNKGMGRNAGGYVQGVVEQDEYVINRHQLKDPYVANFANYLEGSKRGGIGADRPMQISAAASLDAGRFDQAVERFETVVAVLQQHGIIAKITDKTITDIDERKNKFTSTRSRSTM
jgi:hypothetical protein